MRLSGRDTRLWLGLPDSPPKPEDLNRFPQYARQAHDHGASKIYLPSRETPPCVSAQWKRICSSTGMRTLIAKFTLAAILTAPLAITASAQDAKQDMKTAGHDSKAAAKSTGHAVSHAAKTTKSKTKSTVHKGAAKVAKKTDGK